MSLTDDVKAFALSQGRHTRVTTKAREATETGYDLRLRCTCGQAYCVYVTAMAADDFHGQAERN